MYKLVLLADEGNGTPKPGNLSARPKVVVKKK
jgi:hypothetical protein